MGVIRRVQRLLSTIWEVSVEQRGGEKLRISTPSDEERGRSKRTNKEEEAARLSGLEFCFWPTPLDKVTVHLKLGSHRHVTGVPEPTFSIWCSHWKNEGGES